MEEQCISVRNLTKSMNVVTGLIYFPMLLFSGATIPAEAFPEGLRRIANVMPLGVGIQMLKSVSLGIYDKIGMSMGILAGITVLCSVIAVKTFRWE
ncbi:MAG: ABC transporter permease [Lachnospiraceae bacterium]